jgi:hypothetical protein
MSEIGKDFNYNKASVEPRLETLKHAINSYSWLSKFAPVAQIQTSSR